MVAIKKPAVGGDATSRSSTRRSRSKALDACIACFTIFLVALSLGWIGAYYVELDATTSSSKSKMNPSVAVAGDSSSSPQGQQDGSGGISQQQQKQCPYTSLDDLSPLERHPKATRERHIVDPPEDTKVWLVCCQTTQGPWNVAVHRSWAPLGAERFIDMVRAKYWYHTVPLMRCVRNFLCQFGLAGEHSAQFREAIQDDRQWLPPGKDNRKNAQGVKRFQRGYFSYAGAGKNTRSLQIFVALQDDGPLGGGSPWEVRFRCCQHEGGPSSLAATVLTPALFPFFFFNAITNAVHPRSLGANWLGSIRTELWTKSTRNTARKARAKPFCTSRAPTKR